MTVPEFNTLVKGDAVLFVEDGEYLIMSAREKNGDLLGWVVGDYVRDRTVVCVEDAGRIRFIANVTDFIPTMKTRGDIRKLSNLLVSLT